MQVPEPPSPKIKYDLSSYNNKLISGKELRKKIRVQLSVRLVLQESRGPTVTRAHENPPHTSHKCRVSSSAICPTEEKG